MPLKLLATALLIAVICMTCVHTLQLAYTTDIDISDAIGSIFEPVYTNSNQFYGETNVMISSLASFMTSGDDYKSLDWLSSRVFFYVAEANGRGFALANTNMREIEEFKNFSPFTYIYEKDQRTFPGDNGLYNRLYHDSDYNRYSFNLYMSYNPDYLANRQAEWTYAREVSSSYFINIAILLVIGLILFIYLTLVAGRKGGSRDVHLSPLDRVYSDFIVIFMVLVVTVWAFIISEVLNGGFLLSRSNPAAYIVLFAVATGVAALLLFTCYLSLVRKIKARKLLRHSLIGAIVAFLGRVLKRAWRNFKSLVTTLFSGKKYNGHPVSVAMFRRQQVFVGASFLLVAFAIFSAFAFESAWGVIIAFIVEIGLIFLFFKSNGDDFAALDQLTLQIEEIYKGNVHFVPNVSEKSLLHKSSVYLSDIGSGMEKAIDRQLKSERMKIELVTNVSHDLKTPLTSIIGYIELLSREEGLSAEAKDYVTILDKKAQRLKTIIEDLFTLAKTTSGDESAVTMEVIDFRRLIVQTIGDMSDVIEESPFALRTSFEDFPAFIKADGAKVYRVIQNVIDNALKYSMPGTRIYISLYKCKKGACLSLKNTSAYEMDVSAEEILERFVRGDKSRTSEGSGLGLSIAQGFARSMNGDLAISIDGDQFKVEIFFPLVPKPESGIPEPAEPEVMPRVVEAEPYEPEITEADAQIKTQIESQIGDILGSPTPDAPDATDAPDAPDATAEEPTETEDPPEAPEEE